MHMTTRNWRPSQGSNCITDMTESLNKVGTSGRGEVSCRNIYLREGDTGGQVTAASDMAEDSLPVGCYVVSLELSRMWTEVKVATRSECCMFCGFLADTVSSHRTVSSGCGGNCTGLRAAKSEPGLCTCTRMKFQRPKEVAVSKSRVP